MSIPEALIKKAAKALRPYLGCCVDCPSQQGREEARAEAIGAARAVLEAVADDIRGELLESGPLPEGWERHTYVRPQERYRIDDRTGHVRRPDGSQVDVSEWPSRAVIHGPWREGRHD